MRLVGSLEPSAFHLSTIDLIYYTGKERRNFVSFPRAKQISSKHAKKDEFIVLIASFFRGEFMELCSRAAQVN
jgi:hypothetical protein